MAYHSSHKKFEWLSGCVNFSYNFCRGEQNADPESALEFLAKHCQWAVVTLGPNGCIAKHGKEVSEMLLDNFGDMSTV